MAVPLVPGSEATVYLAFEDFGEFGRAFVETHEDTSCAAILAASSFERHGVEPGFPVAVARVRFDLALAMKLSPGWG
jgi:hypothetical protein